MSMKEARLQAELARVRALNDDIAAERGDMAETIVNLEREVSQLKSRIRELQNGHPVGLGPDKPASHDDADASWLCKLSGEVLHLADDAAEDGETGEILCDAEAWSRLVELAEKISSMIHPRKAP